MEIPEPGSGEGSAVPGEPLLNICPGFVVAQICSGLGEK